MEAQTTRSFRQPALSLTSIAGKPAPTGDRCFYKNQVGCQAASRCFCGVRPLERPSGGSAQWAPRQGCRGSRPRPRMADGGGPTEQDRKEGMPSLGEAPNERGKSVWLLCAFQSNPL
jgi:hypothetical protein